MGRKVGTMPQPSSKRNSRRASNPSQILSLVLTFVLLVTAGGVVMTGLSLPVVLAASTTAQAGTSMFDDLPDEIQMDAPSQRSVMVAADGSRVASFFADNRIVVPLEQISPHIQHAVVSIEDRRFYEHKGVDPEGIARALVNNAVKDNVEGASTLTQQYVKNALIERALVAGDEAGIQAARVQNYGRKLREAKLAVTLEKHHTKEEILAGYLNIAPFGPSVYGVEAASQRYFSKHAADLTISEAALLAGITQSPQKYNPLRNPENATQRRALVLDAMERDGFITAEEKAEAASQKVEDMLKPQEMRQGCSTAGNAAYFCEYVTQIILNDEHFGATPEDRRRLLYRGGLTIKTTLDPAKQEAAYNAALSAVPLDDPSNIDVAVDSIEPGTGKIVAMAQNSVYGDPTPENARAKKINLSVGKKYGGGFGYQTGSTGKVFALVEWLRAGHSLAESVAAQKGHYGPKDFKIPCAPEHNLGSKGWSPKNMEQGPGGNSMSVLNATKHSVNRPFAEMASKLDMCNIRKTANDLGALERGDGSELLPNPAMVLGTNELTPLTMANVAATLAANGKRCMPIAITEVVKPDGEAVEVPPITCEQTIPPEVAATATYAMQQVVSPGGTGAKAQLPGRPVAGKTGTTNNNFHAWFLGYTPQLAASVWMGHFDGSKSMNYQRVNGRYVGMLYGGLIPAPTWKNYMDVALQGAEVMQFPAPDQQLISGGKKNRDKQDDHEVKPTSEEQKAVPNVVGRTVADAKTLLSRAGFSAEVGAGRKSEWQSGVVAAQSASSAEPGASIVIFPSTGP